MTRITQASPSRVVRASSANTPGTRGQLRRKHAGGARRVPFALLVTSLVVGGMALLLLLNTASAANELRRHDITARDASVAARVQELQIEVAASAAPANVAEAAAALGMVPAGNPAFLLIGPHGTVRVLGSPAAVSPASVAQPTHHKKASKSATTTATTTATPTTTATSTSHGQSTSTTSARSSSHATPTPTPTPTLTLPGGDR